MTRETILAHTGGAINLSDDYIILNVQVTAAYYDLLTELSVKLEKPKGQILRDALVLLDLANTIRGDAAYITLNEQKVVMA